MLACAQLELNEWHAEEEGLQDALLNRNHSTHYQHCSPGVFKRYVMGVKDGQALILASSNGPTLHNPCPSDTCVIQVPYKRAIEAERD